MRGRAPSVKQAGAGEQHCARANGPDTPHTFRDLFQPAHCVRFNFVLLDRVTTGNKQSVDLTANLPKCFVRGESQPAICGQRSAGRNADDFDRVDRHARMVWAIHVRRAWEHLQRTDEVENFRAGTGDEGNTSRYSRTVSFFVGNHSLLSAVTNLSGAKSNTFLSSSEQK